MHVLVKCPSCNRQSDAGDLEVGRRFHCACGEVLEVPRVKAMDAAVVRCSSCGGPRQSGAEKCTFCGADFTVHERDLHTICPSCMARIMDSARFCHNCGTRIAVQGKSGATTEHPCPVCGDSRRLDSRTLGEPPIGILECRVCAGLWIGSEVFEQVAERMKGEAAGLAAGLPAAPARAAQQGAVRQSGALYRRCPRCDKMMARRNYARRSGVIVDSCPEHGIWFDAGELHALLQWVRRGGLKKAEELERREQEARARQARRAPSRLDRMAGQGRIGAFSAGPRIAGGGSGEPNLIFDLLGALFGSR
jgi:Zn-finger nucleic acid-binding protein